LCARANGGQPTRLMPPRLDSPLPPGTIVFEKSDDGTHWAVDPDGSRRRQLTSGSSDDYAPPWIPSGLSSDGKRLLWATWNNPYPDDPEARGSVIVVTDPDGAHPVRLTPCGGDFSSPQWFAEGSRIVFIASLSGAIPPDRPGQQVFITMRPDGTDPKVLANDAGAFASSPTGARLAVVRGANQGRSSLWILDGKDGSEKRIYDLGSDLIVATTPPAWSPDGETLIFAAEDGLYATIRADGSDLRKIGVRAYLYGAEWSPDGGRILYSGVGANPPGNGDIFSAAPDGSHERNLTNTPALGESLRFVG
jgi:Tol biopolymer transport system component